MSEVKAVQVATAVCNMQGAPMLVVFAVGDDGRVYQLLGGKWEKLPALDSVIDASKAVPQLPPSIKGKVSLS